MPSTLPNVLLIGLRGSGKSTLGRELAARLHRPFVDMDDQTISDLHTTTLGDAWSKYGESGFRQAETRVLRRLLAERGRVIALGGGTPTAPGARELIERSQNSRSSFVVYLRASGETLRERLTSADLSARPSLTGAGTIAEIDLVLARRDGPYRELANEVINVDGLSEQIVLRELISLL